MARDLTFELFGWFGWPLAIAIGILQAYFAYFPSLSVGDVLIPALVDGALACQKSFDYIGLSDYNQEDTIHVLTLVPISVVFVVFLYASRLTVAKLFQPLLSSWEDAMKFGECFIRAIYYMLMFFVVWNISHKDKIWPDTKNCWYKLYDGQERSIELEAYYVIELAYYVSGIFTHVYIDKPLKDYWVMFFHHVVTICLILFSYVCGHQAIGMLVLMCHDVSDVFLDFAKCFHYLDFDTLSTVTFINLLASWLYYRLYLYPFKVIYSVIYEAKPIVVAEGHEGILYHEAFTALLLFLQVLHVYWYYLMLSIAVRKLTDGQLEDIRDEEAVKRQEKAKKSN